MWECHCRILERKLKNVMRGEIFSGAAFHKLRMQNAHVNFCFQNVRSRSSVLKQRSLSTKCRCDLKLYYTFLFPPDAIIPQD